MQFAIQIQSLRPTQTITIFYSPTGNYKVELRTAISNSDVIFQVRAIPNGARYQDNGSSVSGCFNPIEGYQELKNIRFLDVGEKEFMSCFKQDLRNRQC